MPTYKNMSSEYLIFGDIQFKPREEKEVLFYINDPKLEMTKPEPIWSPVQFSAKISSGSVKITDQLTSSVNLIKIVSRPEISLISFNSKKNPLVAVANAEALVIRPPRKIDEIFIHSGEVYVELWNEFSWRD